MELRRRGPELPGHSTVRLVETISQESQRRFHSRANVQDRGAAGNPILGEAVAAESLLGRDTDQFRSGEQAQTDLSIGIVVPLLNEGKTLGHFLSRLYEVSRGRYPVVVVDGGSTDDSVRIGRQFFHTETFRLRIEGCNSITEHAAFSRTCFCSCMPTQNCLAASTFTSREPWLIQEFSAAASDWSLMFTTRS